MPEISEPLDDSSLDQDWQWGDQVDDLKAAMRMLSSGVVVVATVHHGVAHALTATAFCSVSLHPPLVLVCVDKETRFHPAVLAEGSWSVSLLTSDHLEAARHLSTSGRDLATQFDQFPHRPAPFSGAPLLVGALAWLDCQTYQTHDAGDHTIIVGKVLGAATGSMEAAPLTYHRGIYRDS